MNNLIELKSVGTFIDKESGITFPTKENGNPDFSNPYHIEYIDQDEWFDALSKKDKKMVETIMFFLNLEKEVK